jgi:hypothetical protein
MGFVPAGAVHQHDPVHAGRYTSADFVEMMLHGLCIGIRHDQGAADVAGRTDRAEDVARSIALILRLAWTCTFFGPLINQAVFLPDARFVLEPDLNGSALGQSL